MSLVTELKIETTLQSKIKSKPSKQLFFVTKIFGWKDPKDVYDLLTLEVRRISDRYPLYELKGFSNPRYDKLNSVYYMITFKKK